MSSVRECCAPKMQSLETQRSTTQKKFINQETKDQKIKVMTEAYNDWQFHNNQNLNRQTFKSFNKQNAKNLDNVKLFQVNGATYIGQKLFDDNQITTQHLITKNEQLKERYQLKIKQNLLKESQIYKAQQEQEQEQYQNLADNFQIEKLDIDPQEINYALISNRDKIRGVLNVSTKQFLKVQEPVKTKKRKNASLQRNSTDLKSNKLINQNSAQVIQLNSEKKIQRNIIPGENQFQESMMLINEYQPHNRPIFSQIRSVIKPTQTQAVLQNRILKIPGGLSNKLVHKRSALDHYSQVQDNRQFHAMSGPYDQSHESQTWKYSSLSPNDLHQPSLPQLANVSQQPLQHYENMSRDKFGVKSKVDFLNSKSDKIEQNESDADIRKKTLNIFDERFVDKTQRNNQKEANILDGYQFMKMPQKSQEQLGVKSKNKTKNQKKMGNFSKQNILRKTNLSEYQFEQNQFGRIASNDEFEKISDPNREPKPYHTVNMETPQIINIETNPSKSRFENQLIEKNTFDNGFDKNNLYDGEMFKLTKRPQKQKKNGAILAPLGRHKSQLEVNELQKYANNHLRIIQGVPTNLRGIDSMPNIKKSIPWKPSSNFVKKEELKINSLSPPVQRSLENSPDYFKHKQQYNKKVFQNRKSKLVETSTQTDHEMEIFEQNQDNDYRQHLPEISPKKMPFETKDDRQKEKSQYFRNRKQSNKQGTNSQNGREELSDNQHNSQKCEFGCVKNCSSGKKNKWVKLINQEKGLYVPAKPSQEYPQNDDLTEDQYQIKQQGSGKKNKKINNQSSNLEMSRNLLDAKSRSSRNQQSTDDHKNRITEKRFSNTEERRLASQPIHHQKSITPDVPSIQYESVNKYPTKNNQLPQIQKSPTSNNHFEMKSQEKQSRTALKKSSSSQITNNKKSRHDLCKMASSNSSNRNKSLNKTIPKSIHQSDQDKIRFTNSQQDQQKSSTKNSEIKSYRSPKKQKSIREMGTDPMTFDQNQTTDRQESNKKLISQSPNKSERRRNLSESPRKQRIGDWAGSNLYQMIESQKGTMFKDNDWHQFNLQKMQIFTEDEAKYNYTIILKIAAENDDIYDNSMLEMVAEKAENTIYLLCEHMLLSKSFARHFQSSDQPFEEDPTLWSSQRKNTISVNQLYKTLTIDTVIKLLLRVKMLYNTYTEMKQLMCLIYHQKTEFLRPSGPIPELISKISSKKAMSQKEEKELIKAMMILGKLSRRIQQFKMDHKMFNSYIFGGENFQELLLEEAEIIYEIMLECGGLVFLNRFAVPSLDQNEQLVFKKPGTGYQSKRQSLNQKLAKRQADQEEQNRIDHNLQIFGQKSQPNIILGNLHNESSHFESKNSDPVIINLQDADEEQKFIPHANRGQDIKFQSYGANSKDVSDRFQNNKTYAEGGDQIINTQNQQTSQNSDLHIEITSQEYEIIQEEKNQKNNKQSQIQKNSQSNTPLQISFAPDQINTNSQNKFNSLKSSKHPTVSKYQSLAFQQTFRLNKFENEIDQQSNTQSNDTVQNQINPKLKYSEDNSQQKWNETVQQTDKQQQFQLDKTSKSVSADMTERQTYGRDIQQELGKLNQNMSQSKLLLKYESMSRATSSIETVEQKEDGKFYEINQFKESGYQSPKTTRNMIK